MKNIILPVITNEIIAVMEMFNQINQDIEESNMFIIMQCGQPESIVPLTDWEYYSEQIMNIYGLDEEMADWLAKKIANIVSSEQKLYVYYIK